MEVLKDKWDLDYFEIINTLPGDKAFISHDEWKAARSAAGKPTELEKLAGE